MSAVTPVERMVGRTLAPSVDSPLSARVLPSVLSVTAGSADVISFLGPGGLFTAHVTGNLVILAARIATGRAALLSQILSVPVFLAMLALARLLAAGLEQTRHRSLGPLLTLQLVLLACSLTVGVMGSPGLDPDAATTVVVGMLGVAAMAVQNALVQISLVGAPATTVMTTDLAAFVMDIGTILLRRDPDGEAFARARARRTWPAIVGFIAGCSLGAPLPAAMGAWSLALPTSFACLALALGLSVESERGV